MIKMKSSSIKYNHIAIEGNIGSGKTTLAKKLSKDFESRLLLGMKNNDKGLIT